MTKHKPQGWHTVNLDLADGAPRDYALVWVIPRRKRKPRLAVLDTYHMMWLLIGSGDELYVVDGDRWALAEVADAPSPGKD